MPLRYSHTVTMVILRASGEVNEVDMEHREIREVLGCGPSLLACFASDVFGWVRSDGQGPVNKHQLPFDEVHGDIVLCRIDRSSVIIRSSVISTEVSMAMDLLFACPSTCDMQCAKTAPILTSSSARARFPASMAEMSRISFTSSSMCWPLS